MAAKKKKPNGKQATLALEIKPSETLVAVNKSTGAVRKPRVTKIYRVGGKVAQTSVPGRTNQGRKSDSNRHAMSPGQRISKHGHKYVETRENRSDVSRSRKKGKMI